MQSELNCTVCGNEYHNDNLPRLLTACGHTYCEQCLDTMMTEQEDGRHRVSCPEDGTVTFLDTNDVTEFPKNIALIKVIESKKQAGNAFKDESFDLTKIHKKEDSHDDESGQQDIIKQMESGKEYSSSREETYSKEETAPVQEPTPQKQQYELCLLHQKPMDVVCLLDMTKICAKCAIFGEHKGHEFKSIEDIEKEWDEFRSDIMNLYSQKETLEKNIYNQQNSKSIWSIFEQSKRKYQKDITDKFRKIKDTIKILEQMANKKLSDLTQKAEHKISQILKMDPHIQEEYKAWEERSFGLILKTEECNLEDKLKNLNDYTTTRLVPQGEAILFKLKDLQNEIPNYVQNIIKGITIDTNDHLIDALDNYMRISDVKQEPKEFEGYQPSNVKTRTPTTYDQSLLEGSEIAQNKGESIFTQPIPSFEQSLPYQKKAEQPAYLPMNSLTSITPSKTREAPLMAEQSPGEGVFLQKVERPNKKKLRQIKVPQKYEKALDNLYNDTLDVLDLTNAELGDSTILQICEFLRGTKVRTVKFIRNKLSDDVIPKLMSSMHCVVTLNLGQNLLTEHAIDHLINNRNSMPNMKSIILSQNKIIERKHKSLIEKLRKLDLTVSV